MSYSVALSFTPYTIPTLIPGAGWSGATAQPAAVGNPSADGYGETPIGRWGTVPDEAFSGTHDLIVYCDHMEGINHVAFKVDNGNYFHVAHTSICPYTGKTCYRARLQASNHSAGAHVEVRAVVVPVSGVPLVMQGSDMHADAQSMYAYANPTGTLNETILYVDATNGNDSNNGSTGAPFQTLNKALDANDASTHPTRIKVRAGLAYTATTPNGSPRVANDYNYAYWTTIEADDGVPTASVCIASGGRTHTNHVRVGRITVDVHGFYLYPEPSGFYVGADSTSAYNSVGWSEEMQDGFIRDFQSGYTYARNTSLSNMFFGHPNLCLIQNVTMDTMSGDLLTNALCWVKVTASNLGQGVVGSHNDGYQIFNARRNIYGDSLLITSSTSYQFLFFDQVQPSSFRDVVVKNSSFASIDGNGPPDAQFASTERHIILDNINTPQTILLRTDFPPPGGPSDPQPFLVTGKTWVIKNSTVNNATYTMFQSPPDPGVKVSNLTNSGL